MSAASTNNVATIPVTPPSSPKRKGCPGAPARVVRPVDYQPHSGIMGRRLEFGNMGGGAAVAAGVAALQAQMGSMSLGGHGSQ